MQFFLIEVHEQWNESDWKMTSFWNDEQGWMKVDACRDVFSSTRTRLKYGKNAFNEWFLSMHIVL